MTEVLFECRGCRKEWPRGCRCESAYPKTRPLTHVMRPANPAVEVHTEFTYRDRLYRASGWYAESDYGKWTPTPGAVGIWKALDGETGQLVEAPSFGLTKRATSFLWIAFDVEMRRRNPDAMAAAFARRAEQQHARDVQAEYSETHADLIGILEAGDKGSV